MHLWKLGTLPHSYLQFTQTWYKTQALGLNCLWFIPGCAILLLLGQTSKILWASINKDFNSDYLTEESVKELSVLTHRKMLLVKQCLAHAQEFF